MHLFVCKQTHTKCVYFRNFMPIHWTFSMARTFNYFSAAPWKKSSCSATWSQWGCARVPTTLPQIPVHPFWERHTDKGHIQLSLPPSIPPPLPQPPKPRPQTSASSHNSIVCVGSSSARLLSGPVPQHVLYAQTDDTVALARQLQHKENNVLPRSFINTLNSTSQPTVNKGPL